MDYAVFWRDRWLSQVQVVEFDSVANEDILGGGIYDFVPELVVDGRYNAYFFTCREVPGLAWSGFVVDGDFASDWSERCGVVVNRTIVILPH